MAQLDNMIQSVALRETYHEEDRNDAHVPCEPLICWFSKQSYRGQFIWFVSDFTNKINGGADDR